MEEAHCPLRLQVVPGGQQRLENAPAITFMTHVARTAAPGRSQTFARLHGDSNG
jgi:hypothetical protein